MKCSASDAVRPGLQGAQDADRLGHDLRADPVAG